jgi:peptidoglycan hydrolase-like protein with peptidoglycan-binding domain
MDVVTQAKQAMDGWHRGQTSAHYETGGRGPGHVSTGQGDHGGVSYGSYQYATNVGGAAEYVRASRYASEFTGLQPGTAAFTERWKEVAAAHPTAFAQDQHDFIQHKYYDVQMDRLKAVGVDLSDRGPAVQDALWSTSVQYRGMTRSVFHNGLKAAYGEDFNLADLTDEQIVRAAQDYKHDNVQRHFESSPALWDSLRDRATNEKTSLVGLARYDQVNRNPEAYQGKDYQQAFGEPEPRQQGRRQGGAAPMADGMLTPGERGTEVEALQNKLIQAGYTGKDGQPLTADKHYGPNTEHAVREFQQAHGLTVDGKAGANTLGALAAAARQHEPAQPATPAAPTQATPTQTAPTPATPAAPARDAATTATAATATAADLTSGERIRVIEPFGNGSSNRTIAHGTSGEDAFREMKIHHPNANREAVRTGNAALADRHSEMVEGELETVRNRGDRNGIPLVHKDLILTDPDGRRNVMVPAPVAGYAQVNQDRWNSISIWSQPEGHPNRELVGQVLHGERGTTPYKTGDYVEYGAPLIRQSDAGTPGAVHAHIELEPEQYRKYLGDMLNDRLTLVPNTHTRSQPGQPAQNAMADGVMVHGERGDAVKGMQTKLAALGYQGADGNPLSTTGYFGDDTRAAVTKFQLDHGLKDDGKAGEKTLGQLDASIEARRSAPAHAEPTLRDASHPDNARFGQAQEKLHAMEQQRTQAGMRPLFADAEQLDRAAGQLVVATKASGMQQIDTVVARLDGSGVFAVQGNVGDPAAKRACVEHSQAISQTVESSTRQADDLNTQSQSQNQHQEREQTRARGM